MNFIDSTESVYFKDDSLLCRGIPLGNSGLWFDFCETADGRFFFAVYENPFDRDCAEINFISEETAKAFVLRFGSQKQYNQIFGE